MFKDAKTISMIKQRFKDIIQMAKQENHQPNEEIPKSEAFTKLGLPVLYSNLVLIEDMKNENSNYFIRCNGFMSKQIRISSLKNDPFFDIQSCVFRIFPRTYNVNKYKVLDYIDKKDQTKNKSELNFKFAAEIFNNLDIIQNKFAEPVRYGDVVMLMHEMSRMFIKFIPQSKSLTLSNHDSDATLFSLEPASNIMLNDDRVIKSGQPIKLKVAWFAFANQNLCLSLREPYSQTDQNNETQEQNYNRIEKKYKNLPEITIEENSQMQWRFILYSPFNTNERLIIYKDIVQIFYCTHNSLLGVREIKKEKEEKKNSVNNPLTSQSHLRKRTVALQEESYESTDSEKDTSLLFFSGNDKEKLDDSFNLFEKVILDEDDKKSISDLDDKEFYARNASNEKCEFYLKDLSSQRNDLFTLNKKDILGTKIEIESAEDVGVTWVLENIFHQMKQQSFIRYYKDSNLDTYRMAFRIKHLKTGKYLSITKVSSRPFLKSKSQIYKEGYLAGSGPNQGELYKFKLIEDKYRGSEIVDDSKLLNEEYQYSLFGFKSTLNFKLSPENRPMKDDYLFLYHIHSKCYIKIIKLQNQISEDIFKCNLVLCKNPDETDIFKICPVDQYTQWKLSFLQNLYYLTKILTYHIEDSLSSSSCCCCFFEKKKKNKKNENSNKNIKKYKENEENNEKNEKDNINNEKDNNKDNNEENDNFEYDVKFEEEEKKEEEEKINSSSSSCSSEEKIKIDGDEKLKYRTLRLIRFVLDKLIKFTMNKFINKFSALYGFNTVVRDRQLLISNFGFTHLFLHSFIYNYWLHDGSLSRLKIANNIFNSLDVSPNKYQFFSDLSFSAAEGRKVKNVYAMFRYTEGIFEYMIIYCRENETVKAELFEFLYVYFFFINLIPCCLEAMIELFQNQENLLHKVIRECQQNEKFSENLKLIFRDFFPHYISLETTKKSIPKRREILDFGENNIDQILYEKLKKEYKGENFQEEQLENVNLFDLIIEYIKISVYGISVEYNNDAKLKSAMLNCRACSRNCREKYFELLKTLLHVDGNLNIIENQRYVAEKIIYSSTNNSENYKLYEFIDPFMNDYPPVLKDLFYEIAKNNQDDNINSFIKNDPLFQDDKILENYLIKEKDMNFSSDLKMIIVKIRQNNSIFNISGDREAFDKFCKKLFASFKDQENFFISTFTGPKSEGGLWRINFLDDRQVELVVSFLQFVKLLSEYSILNFRKGRKFFVFLTKFLTKNFKYFVAPKSSTSSSFLVGEMTIRERAINERIVKIGHSLYSSIAQSWLKIYQIFKSFINQQIELEITKGIEEENRTFSYKIDQRDYKRMMNLRHDNANIQNYEIPDERRKEKSKNEIRQGYRKKNREDEQDQGRRLEENLKKKSVKLTNKTFDERFQKDYGYYKPIFSKRLSQQFDCKLIFNQRKLIEQKDKNMKNEKLVLGKSSTTSQNENNEKNSEDQAAARNKIKKSSLKANFPPNLAGTRKEEILQDEEDPMNLGEIEIKVPILEYDGIDEKTVFNDFNNLIRSSELLKEDQKKYIKSEITKNIVSIFAQFLEKNNDILFRNFSNYYQELKYNLHCKFDFSFFVRSCIPNLDMGQKNVNYMLSTYCEPFFSSCLKVKDELVNLNTEYDDKENRSFNFVQSLVLAFNIADNFEMQNSILDLIYRYFHQRKDIIERIYSFRGNVMHPENIKQALFNNPEKFRVELIKFYHNYERSKHEYNEKNNNTVLSFFSKFQKEILGTIKNIVLYLKFELRNLSLKEPEKYNSKFEDNENLNDKLEQIIYYIDWIIIEDSKEMYTKEKYDRNLTIFLKIIYICRSNYKNPMFLNIINILQDKSNFNERLYRTLLDDLIIKGKKLYPSYNQIRRFNITSLLGSKYSSEGEKKNKLTDIKNKFYCCLNLLIVLGFFTLPKNANTTAYFYRILMEEEKVLNFDTTSKFLILLYISDINVSYLKLGYFDLLEVMNKYTESYCFGNLQIINIDQREDCIFPPYFSEVFLDILYNIIKYVTYKGKMITEPNLDEFLVDTFLYILRKINLSELFLSDSPDNIVKQYKAKKQPNISNNNEKFSPEVYSQKKRLIHKFVKIIDFFLSTENLSGIFILKINPGSENNPNKEEIKEEILTTSDRDNKDLEYEYFDIKNYFVRPHYLLKLFLYDLEALFLDLKNELSGMHGLKYLKNSLHIYKYFLFYSQIVDQNYLIYTYDEPEEKIHIRNFIKFVLYGYSRLANLYDTLKDGIDYSFMEDPLFGKLFPKIAFSSFYMLLNQLTISQFLANGNNELRGIGIKENPYLKNCNEMMMHFFNPYRDIKGKDKEQNKDNFSDEKNNLDDTDIIKASRFKGIWGDIEDSDRRFYDNVESEYDLKTRISKTTGNNPLINLFIMKKLKLIAEFSLGLDYETRINGYDDAHFEEIKKSIDHYSYNYILIMNLQIINKIYDYFKDICTDKNDKLTTFQLMLNKHKLDILELIKNEENAFTYCLIDILHERDDMQCEQIFYSFLNKIVYFIDQAFEKSKINLENINLCSYLISTLESMLTFYASHEQDLSQLNLRQKTLFDIQVTVEKSGILFSCLKIVNRFPNAKIRPLIAVIFKFFCAILRGGNPHVQESFHTIFKMKNQFEGVFEYITKLIDTKVDYILTNKLLLWRHKKSSLSLDKSLQVSEDEPLSHDNDVLRFLQLLCENHNRKLQLFLHGQDNFRKPYDLVAATQKYLAILFEHYEPFLFGSLLRAFDLLTEFVQGPCVQNQNILINSKLLMNINDLIKYYIASEQNHLHSVYPHVKIFENNEFSSFIKNQRIYYKIKKEDAEERSKKGQNQGIEKIIDFEVETIESMQFYYKNFYKFSTEQISLLTFKASILLLSLVEKRGKQDKIYESIKKIIKPETLKTVCIKIFFEHLNVLNETNDLYDYTLHLTDFNRSEIVEENVEKQANEDPEIRSLNSVTKTERYLILETGFFFYFMLLYFKDFEVENSEEEIMKKEKSKFNITELSKKLFVHNFIIFVVNIIRACFQTLCELIGLLIYALSFGKVKKFNLLRILLVHRKYEDEYAIKFYEKYTQSIEILRDEKVYKIYFFLLPYCKNLNKFDKTNFLEEIDRTNTQRKLMDIIKYADKVKFELENEYLVKEYLYHLPIIQTIFCSTELWKDLSLVLSIVLVLFNFISSERQGENSTFSLGQNIPTIKMKTYRIVNNFPGIQNVKDYEEAMEIMGICQCILAGLILVELFIRKVAAIYLIVQEEVDKMEYSRPYRNIQILIKFLFRMCFNFDFIYYVYYLVFAILGLLKDNFFYSFLLLEIIMRFKTLRNVLTAIKNPYKELLLVFILWIILNYWNSILAYCFFTERFDEKHLDKTCQSLIKCFATIFHQTNKQDNGIGGYIERESYSNVSKFIADFFYDELSNIILKILIINMISGIIIDNFGSLRESEEEMLEDMKNVCTICSFKSDQILKIYIKYGLSYPYHLKKDHNIFNYVFYLIYLYKKDKTEFTGMESYLYELAFNQKDITWFPIKKFYLASEEELENIEDEDEEEEEGGDDDD